MPPRSELVERQLADKGVNYNLTEIDIELFDEERSRHNQARIASPLIPSVVETYVAAMDRGDEFPPLIAYQARGGKFVVIDGNHRLSAAKAAGLTKVWAYVVRADTPSELITMLTYEANTKHGLPTSEAERARHAVYLIENAGESIKHAAARMNLSSTYLSKHYAKVRADNRAGENGIPDSRWHELHPTTRQRLNTLGADEAFKATTEYAIKARLNTEETDRLVVRINKIGSVTEQLRMVNDEEQANQVRIRDVTTGKLRPRQQTLTGPRRTLYNGYIQINAVAGSETALEKLLASFSPLEAEEWKHKVHEIRDRLLAIEEALEKRSQE